jgi:hypothetical protein
MRSVGPCVRKSPRVESQMKMVRGLRSVLRMMSATDRFRFPFRMAEK